ncbi:MAG: hypothetical protein HY786_09635 [Deltaproteobacteria bacterium]|nr:hypothetical protein [Deltaproteobacteria bacterium]
MTDTNLDDLHPTYRQVGKVIGIENALRLGKEFGGENIYFPKLDSNLSPAVKKRHRQIVKDYQIMSVTELAKKYGVTESWVYEVLREARKNSSKNG